MTASSPPGPTTGPFDCTSFSLALAAHREPGDAIQEQASFARGDG